MKCHSPFLNMHAQLANGARVKLNLVLNLCRSLLYVIDHKGPGEVGVCADWSKSSLLKCAISSLSVDNNGSGDLL